MRTPCGCGYSQGCSWEWHLVLFLVKKVRNTMLQPAVYHVLPVCLKPCCVAHLHAGVSAALFEGGLRLGRRLGTPSAGPLQGWRRARLAQLLDGGATLRLQYPKEDLGFVYTASGRIAGCIVDNLQMNAEQPVSTGYASCT